MINHGILEVPRLLLSYKDCLKRCFRHLEEFDLLGYLSPKSLGNDIFISENAS